MKTSMIREAFPVSEQVKQPFPVRRLLTTAMARKLAAQFPANDTQAWERMCRGGIYPARDALAEKFATRLVFDAATELEIPEDKAQRKYLNEVLEKYLKAAFLYGSCLEDAILDDLFRDRDGVLYPDPARNDLRAGSRRVAFLTWLGDVTMLAGAFTGRPYHTALTGRYPAALLVALQQRIYPYTSAKQNVIVDVVELIDPAVHQVLRRTPLLLTGNLKGIITLSYAFVDQSERVDKIPFGHVLRTAAALGWLLRMVHQLELETGRELDWRILPGLQMAADSNDGQAPGKEKSAAGASLFLEYLDRKGIAVPGLEEFCYIHPQSFTRARCLVTMILESGFCAEHSRPYGQVVQTQIKNLLRKRVSAEEEKPALVLPVNGEHAGFFEHGIVVVDTEQKCAACPHRSACRNLCLR